MSNLNLKGTTLFYTPYIHNYLQVTCEQTWKYHDLHTLSLLQMQFKLVTPIVLFALGFYLLALSEDNFNAISY
jgi:hypothetical protein